MLLNVVNYLVNLGKRHSYAGIRASVINGNSARILIAERRAGEGNVLYIAYTLINFTGIYEILLTSGNYFPRLIDIQQAGSEAVNKSVAAFKYAVIETKPAFACLDGNRTRAYFFGFPAAAGRHYVSVLSPVLHVRRLRKIHISKGSMSAVGGTAEHYIFSVDLAGEHYAVSVKRKEGVFALVKFLEILSPAHADGWLPAVSVAPSDPESVLDPYAAGVVAVLPGICLGGFGVVVYPFDFFGIYVPVNAVLGKARMNIHASRLVVNAENTGEFSFVRNHRAVKNGIGAGKKVAWDNGVGVIAPYNLAAAGGSVLPRDIGNRLTVNNLYAHIDNFLSDFSLRFRHVSTETLR